MRLDGEFRRFSDACTWPDHPRKRDVEHYAARAADIGLWQADFEPPWDYRVTRWEVATQQAADGVRSKEYQP